MIRRALVGVLFFSFMLSHADWIQFVRIPILLQHFVDHRANTQTRVTWAGFLALHYQNAIQHPDSANQDHGQLPFLSYHTPTLFIPMTSSLAANWTIGTTTMLVKPPFADFLSAVLTMDNCPIWHPPTT